MTPRILPLGFLALGLGGCSTASHIPPKPARIPVSAATRPVAPANGGSVIESAPEPVYRNPKIGIVYLRPYEDTKGRLFGPQIMYQVTDPGGWNLEAVQQGNGYIPAVNAEIPPGSPSPYAARARELKPPPPEKPLLDPAAAAHIVMTGLMRPEDRGQAEAMARQAGAGFSAIYDSEAGWLILPPAHNPPSP